MWISLFLIVLASSVCLGTAAFVMASAVRHP
jgi:hypothetical protein